MIFDKGILVCTDFSHPAELALRAAESMRRQSRATLHALHVCEYPATWDWSTDGGLANFMTERFEVELLKRTRKQLDEQFKRFEIHGESHVSLGVPFQVISSFIRDHNIGLVVIGHKGSGKTHLMLGGLANKLVASSGVPVMVIKKEWMPIKVAGLLDPSHSMGPIISATSEMSQKFKAVEQYVSLFGDIPSRFIGIGKVGFSTKLLSLTDEDKKHISEEIRNKIRKELPSESKAEVKVDVTLEKKIAYHLNELLTTDHTDTVVMRRFDEGMLEKVLIGSETRRMLEIFEGNILVLPP